MDQCEEAALNLFCCALICAVVGLYVLSPLIAWILSIVACHSIILRVASDHFGDYDYYTPTSSVFMDTNIPARAGALQWLGGLACVSCYMYMLISVKRCTVGTIMVLSTIASFSLSWGLRFEEVAKVPYCQAHSCSSTDDSPFFQLILPVTMIWFVLIFSWWWCGAQLGELLREGWRRLAEDQRAASVLNDPNSSLELSAVKDDDDEVTLADDVSEAEQEATPLPGAIC